LYVCLPRVDDTVAAEADDALPVALPPGTETILVVEDEDGVRRLIADVLRRQGYEVLEAENGVRALEVFEKSGDGVDLVLTDAVMPGMGGLEFINRIADRLGRARVLYMSGYSEDLVARGTTGDGNAAFINKPFTPDELFRRIRELLGRKPAGC
jgi:CheY-like chemotaxis protein